MGTEVRRALQAALPEGSVIVDPSEMIAYRHDQARWAPAGMPAAVVLARSREEVVTTLQIASRSGTPVVPRGAGSGLAGGANAIDGAITLSLHKMDRILRIDEGDATATVQPGVLNRDLKVAVAEQNLWYPPDPASYEFSSLGGNIATNAGGLCCLKYGVTREYVLGLELVLADGSVLRTGRRTIKGVAGYDLNSLVVGSEGTLAVVTEATLRLRSAAPQKGTIAAFFPDIVGPVRAAASLRSSGISPSLLEMMDRTTTIAVDDWIHMGLDREAAALLFIQLDIERSAAAAVEEASDCCERAGASSVFATTEASESETFLTARRLAYPALERTGHALLDDIVVPLGKVPDLVVATTAIAEELDVTIGTFGHLGDGNMHPTIVFDRSDPDQEQRAGRAFEKLLDVALELGGTITGEHGIGALKKRHLEIELGPLAMKLHRSIKDTFDPLGILNPGKVFDASDGDRTPG